MTQERPLKKKFDKNDKPNLKWEKRARIFKKHHKYKNPEDIIEDSFYIPDDVLLNDKNIKNFRGLEHIAEPRFLEDEPED